LFEIPPHIIMSGRKHSTILRNILSNQRRTEASNPSGKPVKGPWGVPASRWRRLDARMTERPGKPNGATAFLNGSDAYATEEEALDAFAMPMTIVGTYVMPELEAVETMDDADDIDPGFRTAKVWPVSRPAQTVNRPEEIIRVHIHHDDGDDGQHDQSESSPSPSPSSSSTQPTSISAAAHGFVGIDGVSSP
jgi:hypothetical protein